MSELCLCKPRYHRLTLDDREVIARAIERGDSLAAIARSLTRPTSCISREIARCGGREEYRLAAAHVQAQILATACCNKIKLLRYPALLQEVHARILIQSYSPAQVAYRLKREYPTDKTMHISTETIYQYIYIHARGELKKQLVSALKRKRTGRRSRSKKLVLEGEISPLPLITQRPEEVAQRLIPGHWEGDLIVGKNHQSAMGTLVERSFRYTLMVPLTDIKATTVALSFARAFQKIPTHLKSTLTYDQGKEMTTTYKDFQDITNLKVFFAHPHSPWEKGTVENTNGMIRRYFPKGTDFTKVTPDEIYRVQAIINNLPRRVLQWQTPAEAFISYRCDGK